MKETEEWRPIKGYEGYYEISKDKMIRSVDRIRIMKIKGKILDLSSKTVDYNNNTVLLNKEGVRKNFRINELHKIAFPEENIDFFTHRQVNKKPSIQDIEGIKKHMLNVVELINSKESTQNEKQSLLDHIKELKAYISRAEEEL